MSNVPPRSEMKATNFPSGEIAGLVSAPSKLVSRVNCAVERGFWNAGRLRLTMVQAINPATSIATNAQGNQLKRFDPIAAAEVLCTGVAGVCVDEGASKGAISGEDTPGIAVERLVSISRFSRNNSARNSLAL